LESRNEADRNQPFSELRLRYFDSFGEKLTRGKSVTEFWTQDLGIRLELPHAIMKYCSNPVGVKPSISVSVPIKAGTLEIKIADGWVRNAPGLIMDTMVICNGPFPSQKETLLKVLNESHAIIHESFFEMTKSLHDLMEPEATE
jgi:hypothetical protein